MEIVSSSSKIKHRLRGCTKNKNLRAYFGSRASNKIVHHNKNNYFKNHHKKEPHRQTVNNKNIKNNFLNGQSGDKSQIVIDNFLNNNEQVPENTVFEKNEEREEMCMGKFSREVYNAICLRLGDTLYIPEDSVQALFNDMHLFPSKTQVSKMLQCARQCGRRNGTKDYLTFGEFCVFVREMQSQNPPRHHQISQNRNSMPNNKPSSNNKCSNSKCEVFLGGSCNPTTWRMDTAIPELQKYGITFFNPQVSIWAPELLAQEHDAKQSASVLLFVIDSQTRSTVGMLEVADLVASGRCVVVVAQPYKLGQTIMGEKITDKEYVDLVEAQKSLLFLVKSKGVKIHSSLPTALQCTANILRNSSSSGASAEEQIMQKLRKLREVYDSYEGEMNLYNVLDAYQKLTNRSLEISRLCNYLSLQNGNITTSNVTKNNCSTNNKNITFERFCALMAEFSTNDGCDMCTTDGITARNYLNSSLYWSCALLKTRHMFRSFLVRPIANVLVWATHPFQRQCSTNNNSCSLNDHHARNCLFDVDSQTEVQLRTSQKPRGYDVFLGGSVSTNNSWRDDVAIPLLKKHGLEYYNPAIREGISWFNNTSSEWDSDIISEWRRTIDGSRVLLFVITEDTRALTSMILAAYCMGSGRQVVLCVQALPSENCLVFNETLTKNAIKDYNRARVYLKDLAERKQVPVFENITEAIECVISKCTGR